MVRKLGLFLIIAGIASAVSGARLGWIGWFGQRQVAAEFTELSDAAPLHVPDGAPLGRLRFASQQRDLVVLEGATEDNLLRGPVHVSQSAEPGQTGNVIIAAHRDTHFRLLKDVEKGQEIDIAQGGKVFHYRVTELAVVEPKSERYLKPTSTAVLTLVTCYPFYFLGTAPQRYIVRAELVSSAD